MLGDGHRNTLSLLVFGNIELSLRHLRGLLLLSLLLGLIKLAFQVVLVVVGGVRLLGLRALLRQDLVEESIDVSLRDVYHQSVLRPHHAGLGHEVRVCATELLSRLGSLQKHHFTFNYLRLS